MAQVPLEDRPYTNRYLRAVQEEHPHEDVMDLGYGVVCTGGRPCFRPWQQREIYSPPASEIVWDTTAGAKMLSRIKHGHDPFRLDSEEGKELAKCLYICGLADASAETWWTKVCQPVTVPSSQIAPRPGLPLGDKGDPGETDVWGRGVRMIMEGLLLS